MYRYRIGDIQFVLEQKESWLLEDEYTNCFHISDTEWDEKAITIKYKSYLINLEQHGNLQQLKKNGMYELYKTEKGLFIIYHWAQCRFGFGYWLEDLQKENIVPYYIHPELKTQIPLSVVRFFSCTGMHSKLLQCDAMVLHASYVAWNEKAILFTAPSQTGKSTQAELWKRYAGAEIINGDRSLLRKRDNIWHSFGYPCCGSSKICINQTLPIEIIVVLEQGNENQIVSMSFGEKVRALVSGAEFFVWSKYEIGQVFALAEALAKEVSIVKLICRPDSQAVDVLKNYLEK